MTASPAPAAAGPADSPAAVRWAGLLVVAAAAAAYGGGGGGPFVFDDIRSIVENPTIRHLSAAALRPPAGGLTVSGRPLLNLSLALNYAAGGLAVGGYHAANLAAHALAGLLLFGVVRRTLGPRPDATALGAAIALLWVVHPLQTETVLYVVQRAEGLMGLGYLLTLYAFVRGTVPGTPRPGGWLAVSWLACLAGMATKEVMVSAPVLVLLYDRTFVAGSFRGAWAARRRYYGALACTWVLLAALVAGTGGNRGGTSGFGTGVAWGAYWLTQFPAVARYLGLAFWPHPLVFDYEPFWVRTAEVWPAILLVLGLLGATAWALRRRPAAGFLGAWFFALLAPTSLVAGGIQMMAEHRMYLPLAAVLAAAVLALRRIAGLPTALALCLLAALAGGIATARRAQTYGSALALWGDTAARRPANAFAQNNLGKALYAAGRREEAAARYARAAELDPADAEAHYNLGNVRAEEGRLPEAVAAYREALALAPRMFEAHNNLGLALGRTGQGPAAAAEFEETLRLQPSSFEARVNLADTLAQLGRLRDAIAQYEEALRLEPTSALTQENLAMALAQDGRVAESLPHFEAAVRLAPADPELRANLALVLEHAGQPERAAAERAAAARPGGPNGVDPRRP